MASTTVVPKTKVAGGSFLLETRQPEEVFTPEDFSEQHQLIGGTPNLNWFYGGGAYFGVEDNLVHTGPMGVVGIDYKFDKAPINLSLDWKPELDLAPAIDFIPDALAISVRFTLK